ncbi:zinc finger protein 135 [Triplophysa dalaica]|uniref:zinc finger protein 135 n=1 Tax=Triplophysa dalaica TaxID=1582913 RepID=UPI0024DFE9BF|nr:zinc finger protein 135 [Triplophysa dalaica]
MTKLDLLHSHLLNRLSAVIREIFEEVETTVKDYQEETVRTRAENATLKRQLRDVLMRTETHFKVQVHNVSQNIPNSQNETEDQETQRTENHGLGPASFRDEKPCILELTPISKTESNDRESEHLKDRSSTLSHLSTGELLVSQSMDERRNMNLPCVGAHSIKIEQEDTFITITPPAHAGQCQDSDTTHQLRTVCDTSTTLKKKQRKELNKKDSGKIPDDHHREGPYKCNKCGRQLKDLAKLQLHRKLHERSFSCHWCGRNFSKFDYLRFHMRTHTGERPYRCNWCSKTFTQCGNMRRHERTCQRFIEEATAERQTAA